MVVLFLAQESWHSFRKIGGRVFYYILLARSVSWSELVLWVMPTLLGRHCVGWWSRNCVLGCCHLLCHLIKGASGTWKRLLVWIAKNREVMLSDSAGATQFPNWFGWSQRHLAAHLQLQELDCILGFSSWVTAGFTHLIPRFSLWRRPAVVFGICCIKGYLWGSEE